MKILFGLAFALMLTSCGGGSDGGTGMSVTFSTSSLKFDYFEDLEPWSETMTAQASGATGKDVVIGAEVSGTGIALPIQVAVDTVSRAASITVTPQRGMAPGTYSGTIRMFACTTQACSQHHAGSPHPVAYTVTVLPKLKPNPASLSLAAPQTGSASAQVQVTLAANASLTAKVFSAGEVAWLTAQVSGSSVTVLASAASLQPGTYRANISLKTNRQERIVPVTFTVSPA